MKTSIENSLKEAFHPSHLDVVNESYKHNVPKNAETHFKVVIVCEGFSGKPLVERHREVYRALATQMNKKVHALSLQTLTPAEWEASQQKIATTPNCLGGSHADKK